MRAGALEAWPFLRPLELASASANLILQAPDTDGDGCDDVILERAFTQNEAVYDALPGWSAGYPEVAFALVEVEEVAGRCRYGGFVCRGGVIESVVVASRAGDRTLLRAVGVELGEPLGRLLGAIR